MILKTSKELKKLINTNILEIKNNQSELPVLHLECF